MLSLPQTIDFVYQKFNGQFRKGGPQGELIPSFVHSLNVMYAGYRVGITNPDVLKGYLCHDLYEDTNTTKEELVEKIGTKAEGIVEEMTYRPAPGFFKRNYLNTFKDKSVYALIGKELDRTENVKDFLLTDSEYAVTYFWKAETVHDAFFARRLEIIDVFGEMVYINVSKKVIDLMYLLQSRPIIKLRSLD